MYVDDGKTLIVCLCDTHFFPLSDSLPRATSRQSFQHSRASSTGSLSSGFYNIPPYSDREDADNADDNAHLFKMQPWGPIPKNSQIISYSDEEEEEPAIPLVSLPRAFLVIQI